MSKKLANKEKEPKSIVELFTRPIKPVEEIQEQSDIIELPDRYEQDLQLEGDENLSAFQIKVS